MVILSEFLPEKHEIVKELQLQKGLITLGYRDDRCNHTVNFLVFMEDLSIFDVCLLKI
jgi:hypothetical protein